MCCININCSQMIPYAVAYVQHEETISLKNYRDF